MTGFDAKIRREQPDPYQINFYTDNEGFFDMVQSVCRLCVTVAVETNKLKEAQKKAQQESKPQQSGWISVEDDLPPGRKECSVPD